MTYLVFMVKIIGIAGKRMVGKTTFAELYLESHININQHIYMRAFADPLKETCKILFNLSNDQLNNQLYKEIEDERWNKTPRKIMQWLGTDIMRKQFREDFWIYNWLVWYNSKKWNNDDIILIPDVRFQNEIEFIHNILNGKIILIKRSINMTNIDEHLSEKCELHDYDLEFDNNSSLDYLRKFASDF